MNNIKNNENDKFMINEISTFYISTSRLLYII